MGRMCVALLSGGLVLAPLTAEAGGPVGATLQTEGNAESGGGGQRAAGDVERGRDEVRRQTRNRLRAKRQSGPACGLEPDQRLQRAPGRCGLVPVAFTNVGGGIYTIGAPRLRLGRGRAPLYGLPEQEW